ncbi:phosphoesterase PA-phosphatase related protein [Fibrisoma limi BUZ 3]|uniref:Phosphoesterase PA-phosphatase related protein n=1 Tax=Fibrisoma limi BUZ 3 TaxID=1185876 RepID=I2GBC7_9BACT|nr:phosphatase PAP2 family protein [Fibrisoma limi]CCH51201.1 phosphoesterase PA-phosphatase related protein [Fibrisoma limi BUZ 3]
MKKYSWFLLTAGLLFWTVGCKEPVIDEPIPTFYAPATTDPEGGNWRPILFQSVADVCVSQPEPVTSDAYKTELIDVQNGAFALNVEQIDAVNYWAAGGVLRWNQIARQLIAKYNVTPGYNDATGQTVPFDPNKPIVGFPAAARILALLSVAQYDALVAAWHAKYLYNRPSLARQGVTPRLPVADLPSYPSEDAAVAEVSCQVLALLFPDETNWLIARAGEHKQSRIWGGANVPSDIKAGDEIAHSIAQRVITYVQNDGIQTLPDVNNAWEELRRSASYDVKWVSLAIPARPPILPQFGTGNMWFSQSDDFRKAPAPPATTSPAFQSALAEVRTIADNRSRDEWRIANLWADGVGTYTPAGHWNLITEDLIRQDRQNELRAARTLALLNRALQDGALASWFTKYQYFVPRPSQLDPTIKAATEIPNYPSYVSEIATMSGTASTVLGYLFPSQAARINEMAAEAAVSQLYGGTQYRFDSVEGIKIGQNIGQAAVNWAKADGAK